MSTIDVDGGILLDKPKDDLEVNVRLTINGIEVYKDYKIYGMSEIEWNDEMDMLADRIEEERKELLGK